jgi:ATP phosphoribosyltransferase regulatory subunit
MVYQSPLGARDLLPLDVIQKHWIEDRLQQVFHQWGYHRIITSTLERLDTLMAGGAIQRSTVFQLQEADGEALGLRPELTASIARAAVTRMAGTTFPQRLYYNANIFRRSEDGSHNRQQEFYQAGVELLGAAGLVADAEILLLVMDCLNSLGLTRWQVILGNAGLMRSLLDPFPPTLQTKVRRAIAHLDRLSLETMPMSSALRDRALLLLDLRGKPADVLQRLATLDLTAAEQETLTDLKSLVELLQDHNALSSSPDLPPALILDLSLIRTFDYYTGIVFEVVGDHSSGIQILGQGGRYDQLLGVYHPQGQTYPGIGFSLQLEHLHQVLSATGQLPQHIPASDWLVVPSSPQVYTAAFTYAQTLRHSEHTARVELDLGERTVPEVYEYARHRRICQIAWIQAGGKAVIETVNNQ